MEKLYSKIVRSVVVEEDGVRPICNVRDLVIDPNDGKVVALSVGKGRVIVPADILSWGMSGRAGSAVKINRADSILDVEDIVRVQEVWGRQAQIFEQKVETVSGKELGSVVDFVIDSKAMVLKKLYVAKVFLGLLRLDHRIISAKDIVEILPGKIVVKDDLGVVKERAAVERGGRRGEEKVELCPAG